MQPTTLFEFEAFPTLQTPRLVLREIMPEDDDAVFRLRADVEVTRYNTGRPYTHLDQARDLIDDIRRGFDDRRELRWAITLKAEPQPRRLIGMCGYNFWLRQDRRASIGYDLLRSYWGKGIMTEALDAVLAFGFSRMDLNRIEADVSTENIASRRVLEKLGFTYEGTQREQYYEWGDFHDLELYSLLRREYERRALGSQR